MLLDMRERQIFPFMYHGFDVKPKNFLGNPKSPKLSYFFKSYNFTYTFKSMFNFEFIFVQGVKFMSVFFSVYRYPIVLAPFVERQFFSVKFLLHLCQRSVGIFVEVYFWAFHSIPLIYVCIPLPILHVLILIVT